MDLGLSSEEFFRLTPRQFHLMVDHFRRRLEHWELLTGIIAANVANLPARIFGGKMAPPADYMPSRIAAREDGEDDEIDRERIANDVRAFFERAMKIGEAQKGRPLV